ncbi:MAG: DUF6371 domain-containing protein, partial [Bacteroidota bacterium]|nr:DUF6371 domain-containing protein [Bacteroidota bacterium]
NLLSRVKFPFTKEDVDKVIRLYKLGTVIPGSGSYMLGAVTFPFIDENGKTRSIQAKLFDIYNHTIGTNYIAAMMEDQYKRSISDPPGWLVAHQKQDLKVSCLFGAHLLQMFPKNKIALVEAPKTAVYGSLYFGIPEGPDDLLWLAVYNKSTLTLDRCKCLKGRTVYLFPDLSKDGNTYDLWKSRLMNCH